MIPNPLMQRRNRAAVAHEDARVAVIGLGMVGIPLAVSLATANKTVTGLDLDEARVQALVNGEYPIGGHEPGLAEGVKREVSRGRLRATTQPDEALRDVDVAVVCVQTPFDTSTVEPRYDALRSALTDVGRRLRKGMLVIVESTIAPTTTARLIVPTLEQSSGLSASLDFHVAHCPERVTPGKLLANLKTLARVVGGHTPEAAERAIALYSTFVEAELSATDALTAEIVKTAENAYRDVQIAFANELAMICERLGADAVTVRELVNKSPGRFVHEAGGGVGGHCIPKDTWLLWYPVKDAFRPTVMLGARKTNDAMPIHVAGLVGDALTRLGRTVEGSSVCILGAAYRHDTEDSRESPTVPLVEALRAAGALVRVHDPLSQGTMDTVPISSQPLPEFVEGADAVVLMTAHSAYREVPLAAILSKMRTRLIVDGRSFWDPTEAGALGAAYVGVGRRFRAPAPTRG